MGVESVYNFLGGRYILPAGAIARIGPIAGNNAFSVKLLTGGTLEIGGWSLAPSTDSFTALVGAGEWVGSGGQTFGQLYPVSAGEIFSGNFAGQIHLYASAATCVVAIAYGLSQGN